MKKAVHFSIERAQWIKIFLYLLFGAVCLFFFFNFNIIYFWGSFSTELFGKKIFIIPFPLLYEAVLCAASYFVAKSLLKGRARAAAAWAPLLLSVLMTIQSFSYTIKVLAYWETIPENLLYASHPLWVGIPITVVMIVIRHLQKKRQIV